MEISKEQNDYNYWVLLAADRGIELKKLQKENEELKARLDELSKNNFPIIY